MSRCFLLLALAPLATACGAPATGPENDIDFRCGEISEVGLIGLDRVVVAGNPAITGPAASVFSNHLVELAGSFEIDGDAVSGGVVQISGPKLPDGDVIEGAHRIDVPDPTSAVLAAESHNDNTAIPCVMQGNQCNSPVSGDGVLNLQGQTQLTLPAGSYFFHGIAVHGQAKLHIGGPVTIHVDGPVTLNGGSSTNPGTDVLTLVSSGAADIRLNGNADSRIAIVAPFASVRFSGTQGFHGTALGRELHINGTADLESTGDLVPITLGMCPGDLPHGPDRQGPVDGPDQDG